MKRDRKSELLEAIEDDVRFVPLIDEMVYLEEELDYLRKLPKMKVHPKDKTRQKPTPALRAYREALTQYTNIVRLLIRATGTENEETSPLREWLASRKEAEV